LGESQAPDGEMTMALSRSSTVNALVSVIAVLIALFVLEGGTRLVNPAPVGERADTGGGLKAILQFDPMLETRYVPNAQTRIVSPYGEFDLNYHINDLGLRDRTLTGNADEESRILVVGNSFVEGWGVNEEDGFIRIAEQVINQRRAGTHASKNVRLVNGGMSSYGAAQSYLHAKMLWPLVKPAMAVMVVVGTMVNADFKFLKQARLDANDVVEGLSADSILSSGTSLSQEKQSVPTLLATLAKYSAVAHLVAQRIANQSAMDRIKVGDPETDMLAAYRSDAGVLERMYRPTLRHAGALARLARESGKPFVLIHLPMAFQVSANAWDHGRKAYRLEERVYDSNEEALVRDFCAEQGMTCLFADEPIKSAQRSEQEALYFRYDFHFTPAGNRALGNWLGRELADLISKRAALEDSR
jgi:hypothetical protein